MEKESDGSPCEALSLKLSVLLAGFAALAAVAPVLLALDPGVKGWGLARRHPFALLALTAASLGGLGVVPVLLCFGAVAVARGRLERRRYLVVILPLNLAAVTIPWLAYGIVEALVRD